MMTGLELLIESAVAGAGLEVDPVFTRFARVPVLSANRQTGASIRNPVWSQAEKDFLAKNLGWLSEDQIAEALGRTRTAVHLKIKRLRLPAPSRHPDFITGHQAALLIGIDGHKVVHWCDAGLIPHRIMAGDRKVRLIYRTTLYRWVVSPSNWIYFDWTRIPDYHLRRLCELRSIRWGDQWWTTRQVADLHGVDAKDVYRLIVRGEIPGVRASASRGGRHPDPSWLNWYVRKSDALRAHFVKGKGGNTAWVPSDRCLGWIRHARLERGWSWSAIVRSMGRGRVSIETLKKHVEEKG